MISLIIFAMGIGRVLIGLAPLVAPRSSSRLLGFPEQHDNATARLMARMFGVRDVGLGALVFYARAHPSFLGFVLLFNAATDLADLVVIAVPLARREGIDRAAWTSAAFALTGGLGWVCVYFLVGMERHP